MSIGSNNDAMRRAVEDHAKQSGGPPLVMSLTPQSMRSQSALQQSLAREQTLDDARVSANNTWGTIQRMQASMMPDELDNFCNTIEEEEANGLGPSLPGSAASGLVA